MIKKLMFCFLTIVVIKANAQYPYTVPNKDWIKQYSQADLINSAPTALDANSSVYSTGYVGNSPTGDLLALKYDSTGVQVYAVPYDYNGGHDVGKAIKVDGSGNAIIVGISEDVMSGNTTDGIILKLSPTGSPVWTNPTRFGAGGGNDEITSVCIDANNDIYATGKIQVAAGDFDIIVLKIDGTTGTILWQQPWNGSSNMDDEGTGIVLSSNGLIVYVCGNTIDSSTGSDIVLLSYDTGGGSVQFSPVITNGVGNGNDKSAGIILTGAHITIVGETDNTTVGSGMDGIVIKYDGLTGAVLFLETYNAHNLDDRFTSLVRDSTGNIGCVGTAFNGVTYEYHTVLFDSTLVQYGVNVEGTGLASLTVDPKICNDTIAHHWYVCGEIMKATKDIFVYQISPSGLTAWRQYIDGQDTDIDAATGIAVNGVGVVYVGGMSKNSLADYDYTTIKLNQTPVYWPPDFAGEPVNMKHLYIKNNGQLLRTDTVLASEVLYYTHNTTPEVFIEKDAFNFVYRKNHADTNGIVLDTIERIQYKFLGSNTWAGQHEYLPRSTVYNYFLGYAASSAITDLQGNERIFIPNFYPYVDLHYFSCKDGIKYYLVAKPGALIDEIRMQIDGEISTGIDAATGQLSIAGQLGTVVLEKPVAYTVNMLGQVVPITTSSAAWGSIGTNMYNIIAPSGYNSALPLIIQVSAAPVVLSSSQIGFGAKANLDYSTYYGSSGNEVFNDIKAASNGDRHVTGSTDSQFFPNINSMFTFKSLTDVVILKYTADDTLRVASFMGGSRDDVGNSIAVNSLNEVFVGGNTWSSNFVVAPLTGATNQNTNGYVTVADYEDGFLTKFLPTVTSTGWPSLAHNWGRYFGGPGNDEINSICLDGAGNLHFVGEARSSTIAALVNPAQSSNANTNNSSDVILGKFDTNLAMVYGTFLGGNNSPFNAAARDIGYDITVDNSGNAIICGRTDALNFPCVNSTGNPNTFFDNSIGSPSAPRDGFIARYSPTGTKQFASFFGGNGIDQVTRLAHDPYYDDIYFAGDAYDTTAFPFLYKAGALNSRYKVARSAFIGQMGGDLTKKWCSFYGHGVGTHSVSGLCVDNVGIVYMSGMTTSDTIHRSSIQPATVVYKDSIKNSTDGFIAIFNHDKSLYHAHYFGGTSVDQINGADVSQNLKLYVVGNTSSNDFPIAYDLINATEIDSSFNGGGDGFISRFDLNHYQVTGLDDIEFKSSNLKVYPNPANTGFNLQLTENIKTPVQLNVHNLMGQLIYQETINEEKSSVNCESWANGVYLISVSNTDGKNTFKLIKN